MTTAAERKARREERLLKEAKKEMFLQTAWTGLKYIGATAGSIAAAIWLALVIQENPEWANTTSWVLGSLGVGAILFYKAAK